MLKISDENLEGLLSSVYFRPLGFLIDHGSFTILINNITEPKMISYLHIVWQAITKSKTQQELKEIREAKGDSNLNIKFALFFFPS
jgi:hypothetical protein